MSQFNPDAEMSVLGSMILDYRAAKVVRNILTEKSFFRPAHQIMFRHILGIYDKSRSLDIVLLKASLLSAADPVTGSTDLENIGGAAYMIEVAEFVPSPDNAVHYAKIVRDLEAMRMLDKLGEEPGPLMSKIVKDNPKASVHEHRLKYNQEITHEAARILGRGERTLVSMKESLKRHTDRIDAIIETGDTGVTSCGLPSLDDALVGFKPGEQWILGAYSGQGKTALAFEMATRAARSTGKTMLFISGEMSEQALMERFVTSQTGISVQDQYKAEVVGIEENYIRIQRAQEDFYNLPIFVCYRPKGIEGIKEAIIEAKREGELAAVFVDYLQIMIPRNSRNTVNAIDDFVYEMKDLAGEYEFTSILLTQFNQESQKSDGEPTAKDIKGSGGIFASADWVLLCWTNYNPELRHDSRDRWDYWVKIAKARNGARRKIDFEWTPCRTKFHDPLDGQTRLELAS